jgi:hypothetical protein
VARRIEWNAIRVFVTVVRCLHFPPHHIDGGQGIYITPNRRPDSAVVIREKARAASKRRNPFAKALELSPSHFPIDVMFSA